MFKRSDLDRREQAAQAATRKTESDLRAAEAALVEAKTKHANAQAATLAIHHERRGLMEAVERERQAAEREARVQAERDKQIKSLEGRITTLDTERLGHEANGNRAGTENLWRQIQELEKRRAELVAA